MKNYCIKVTFISFEDLAELRYLKTVLPNQKCIHKEKNIRLNPENVFYHVFCNVLSCSLQSENLKIKIYNQLFCMGAKLGLEI
jgi:hypothetical protein